MEKNDNIMDNNNQRESIEFGRSISIGTKDTTYDYNYEFWYYIYTIFIYVFSYKCI